MIDKNKKKAKPGKYDKKMFDIYGIGRGQDKQLLDDFDGYCK